MPHNNAACFLSNCAPRVAGEQYVGSPLIRNHRDERAVPHPKTKLSENCLRFEIYSTCWPRTNFDVESHISVETADR